MRSNTKKAVAVSGVAALALLGGTYATFTSNATAPAQEIATGTVNVDFNGGTWGDPISNLAAGDVATRDVTVVNTSTIGLKPGTIELSATFDDALSQLLVDEADATAEVAGADESVQFKLVHVNAEGGEVVVLDVPLADFLAGAQALPFTAADLEAGNALDLRAEYTVPQSADNSYQDASVEATFTIDVVQRDAQRFIDGSPDGETPANTVLAPVAP